MPKKKPASSKAAALQQRIQQLANEHSPSVLARRTDAGLSNVSRYLSGTRVPAEFCIELVHRFGVNPAWLLTGEGSPYLADITAGTVKMAGNVLELVEAMNSVAQMRLGALTGKHHLGVLRELNDALGRYEDLRARLNTHSAPIFERLLGDLEKALLKRDLNKIADLRKAASQVARLCDDSRLSHRFTRLQAHAAVLAIDADEALHYQRMMLRDVLMHGRMTTAEQCDDALRLALMLHGDGKTVDALRIHQAFAILADDETRRDPAYADLRFFEGVILALRGDLREGMGLMQHWHPRMSERRGAVARALLTRFGLIAGLLTTDEALGLGADTEPKFTALIEVGIWREDKELLQRALARFDHENRPQGPAFLRDETLARHVLEALRLRPGQIEAKPVIDSLRDAFKQRMPSLMRESGFPDDYCVQIALIIGDRKEAARWQARARQHHTSADARENMNVVSRAMFLRNEIRLDPDSKEAGAARRELQGYVDNGYWLLRSALTPS